MISLLSINQLGVKCCLANDFVFRKISEAHDQYTQAVVHYIKIMGLKLSAPKHRVRHRPCHGRYKNMKCKFYLGLVLCIQFVLISFLVAKFLGVC